MKRFCAALISILFIVLCGCKSPAELLSDFSEKLGSDLGETYDNIGDMFSDVIPDVIDKGSVKESEVIVILPGKVTAKNAKLKAYKKLSSKQKKLYSIMLTAVRNMELKDIDITNYVSKNGFSDSVVVHRAVLCDNPDIFWMPKKISFLSVKGTTKKYIAFKEYNGKNDNKGFYGITKAEKAIMQKRFDAIVNKVVSKARGMKSLFERELYIHDYICKHVKYDTASAGDFASSNPDSITAYGALVEGKAICEGYSKAMQLLCVKCGIPCSLVFGEHDGVPHMWNIVNPGDGLYYLDATFDDSSDDYTLHRYFNVTKKEIKKDHVFDARYSASAVYDGSKVFNFFDNDCSALLSNYYEKNDAYIEEDCALAVCAISEAANGGKHSVELKNTTNRSLKSAFNLLCKKARGTVNLKTGLYYENNDVLIVTW